MRENAFPESAAAHQVDGRLNAYGSISEFVVRSHVTEIDRDVLDYLISDTFQTTRELERAIEAAALSDTNRFTKARLLFTPDTAVRE